MAKAVINWPLCLSFSGRLMIHYSWPSACVEPGFLLPFKSNLNIHKPAILLLLPRARSLTLPSFFPNLPMCVFRLLPLFIQSDETSRPDGRWIIMSFIFKSTALSSQWPNQFKYFPKLQSTHTHPARCKHSHTRFTFCFFYKHAEDIVLSTPR